MYLHEFQTKEQFVRFGISVAPFLVVSSIEEVTEAVQNGLQRAVLKIQVHAGGRGKAGGIKVAKGAEEILEHARQLIGMRLVNNQTGPEGVIAEKLILDTPVVYKKEYYLAVVIDRKNKQVRLIASNEGGTEIEELAKEKPEKIFVETVPENGTLRLYQLNRLAKKLGLSSKIKERGFATIQGLLKAFFALDATLLEINPLVETDDDLVALDAKCTIDDNALFRHKELAALWDSTQLSRAERKAHEADLAFVALNGTIGCMVNGAGLAMATMDLIRFYGKDPANFLDVGGGASEERVLEGFYILLDQPNVEVILVNIFGGIMNCETIAKALVEAKTSRSSAIPIVVRMEGTNVKSAQKMLKESKLDIITADSLDEAAKKACEIAAGK